MFCLRLLVVLLCSFLWAGTAHAIHPNQKKIGKWNGKITRLQGKIDHENSRPASMVVTSVAVAPPLAVSAAPPPVVYSVRPPTVIHRYRVRTYIIP